VPEIERSCQGLINHVTTSHRVRAAPSFLFSLLVFVAAPVAAQSPNNSTVVVLVTDQSGAVVTDAKVTVRNNQTGALRAVTSGGVFVLSSQGMVTGVVAATQPLS